MRKGGGFVLIFLILILTYTVNQGELFHQHDGIITGEGRNGLKFQGPGVS